MNENCRMFEAIRALLVRQACPEQTVRSLQARPESFVLRQAQHERA